SDTLISNLATGWYTVTVTDANNCVSVDSVFIDEPPALTSTATTDQDATCVTDTDGAASATAAGGTGPYTFVWNDPNAQTTASATNLGVGNYTVTITDAQGCTSTSSATVSFTAPTPEPSLGNDTMVCVGSTLPLNPTGPGGPFIGLTWSDGSTGGILPVTMGGTYAVTVTNLEGCTGADTIVVTEAIPDVLNLGNDIAVANGPVTLDAGSNFSDFLWSTGETTQTISVTNQGSYIVEATDGNGCRVSDTIAISFWPVGIAEASDPNRTLVYPNPTDGNLSLVPQNNRSIRSISIINILGQPVLRQEFLPAPGTMVELDLHGLPAGSYFLRLTHEEGEELMKVQVY
ncbi:MAG: T9SS type A sorting domain-containing protein, partial [Bacteroidota bacterium]